MLQAQATAQHALMMGILHAPSEVCTSCRGCVPSISQRDSLVASITITIM